MVIFICTKFALRCNLLKKSSANQLFTVGYRGRIQLENNYMNMPIALIDSGVGGLTVLQKVMQILPNESYIYLADNAFFPYGTKPFDVLDVRLQKVTNYLISLGVKAIVVACNTASLHIESMQKQAKFPVIDVIVPTCKDVLSLTKNKKVCLLATDATVHSGVYQQILNSNGVEVVPFACSNFVPIAESSVSNTFQTKCVVREHLAQIAGDDFDTVIFGCTHFGLMKESINQVLGNRNYVECGDATALHLKQILQKHNLLGNAKSGELNLVTTGKATSLEKVARSLRLQFTDIKVVQLD